jgi:peptidoglycan/xylan/chitin deacetylase (PgdA/CDA1 family)
VGNVVALTFDDGPYYYTSALLDLLKQHGAKATFFITGNNFNKGPIDDASSDWPALITRMHNEGHQIGTHTWTHADLSGLDEAGREYELVTNENALRNILGFTPTYMRPPYGSCSRDSGCLATATRLGYHVVNWDVDTKDFEGDLQRSKDLFDAGFDGSSSRIILNHDTHQQTVTDLAEYMLNRVNDANFKAVTVGECLGDPQEYWYTGGNGESLYLTPVFCPGCRRINRRRYGRWMPRVVPWELEEGGTG